MCLDLVYAYNELHAFIAPCSASHNLMSDALPPIASLIAFAHAARTLSFKRAAREVHVSPSALTRQIQQLERHLGCALFLRTNTGLALTSAGERYFEVASRCLSQLREAQTACKLAAQPLRVSALQSFSESWLVPQLPALQRAHPGLELEIEATFRYADFDRDPVDVAIRFGDGEWPGLHAEPLLDLHMITVCSPQLQGLSEPADLAAHTLIHISQVPRAFGLWLAAAGVPELRPSKELRFDHVSLALSAAEAGLGVALCPPFLCAQRIAAGRLRQAFPLRVRASQTYHFVCKPEALHDPRVSALRDWLVDGLAQIED
jgi:LysR family glycine cleavage system transcriptional activator